MKKVILRIPTYAFVGGLILSTFLSFQFTKAKLFLLADSGIVAVALIFWFWTISVADYMCSEAKNTKLLKWVYIITSVEMLFYLLNNLNVFRDTAVAELPVYSYMPAFLLVNAILMTTIIKRVFYARSYYFVFIETFIPVVGVITLTPEIQEWEKSDKT